MTAIKIAINLWYRHTVFFKLNIDFLAVIIALTLLHRIQHSQGCHIDDTADRSPWSEDVHRLCAAEHHRTYRNTIARCGLE